MKDYLETQETSLETKKFSINNNNHLVIPSATLIRIQEKLSFSQEKTQLIDWTVGDTFKSTAETIFNSSTHRYLLLFNTTTAPSKEIIKATIFK